MTNNKIITFVVFIAAAIMTSLFVFHTTHKQTLTVLNDGNATIFPVARDIKPFELHTASNATFTERDLIGHWTLLFFGFTHCANVCPTTLDMLAQSYQTLHTAYPKLQVVLVSLDPMRDTLADLAKYTQSFNTNFIGITGKIQDVRKLQSQLGVFSAQETNTTDSNYQIQHSSSIMLIDPQGKWAGLFKFGMTPEQFIAAFQASMATHA